MEINIDELRAKTAAAGKGQAADPEGKKTGQAADDAVNEWGLKLRRLLTDHTQEILDGLVGNNKNEYAQEWVDTLVDGVQQYCDRMTVPGESFVPETVALICLAAESTADNLKAMIRSGKFGKGLAGFYEIAQTTMDRYVVGGIAMTEDHFTAEDIAARRRKKR